MAKVYQNLSWAVAYNVIAIPIAAGVLLPQFDFAMTPSLSGEQPCTTNLFLCYSGAYKALFSYCTFSFSSYIFCTHPTISFFEYIFSVSGQMVISCLLPLIFI